MYERELQEFGLTEGESKVYSFLLGTGYSTVGPIVKNSKVAYSNIYEILERLMQKGLVSYIVKERTRHYKALQPSRLGDYLENRKQDILKQELRLKNFLPRLQEIGKGHEERSAEIYTGTKGLRTAYENLLQDAKEEDVVLFFYSYDSETYKEMNRFYYQLFPKFKKKRTLWRGIANARFREQSRKERPPKNVEIKFVEFPVPSNIDIFNNKILITSWKDFPMGILITSREIAETFSGYFNNLWEISESAA